MFPPTGFWVPSYLTVKSDSCPHKHPPTRTRTQLSSHIKRELNINKQSSNSVSGPYQLVWGWVVVQRSNTRIGYFCSCFDLKKEFEFNDLLYCRHMALLSNEPTICHKNNPQPTLHTPVFRNVGLKFTCWLLYDRGAFRHASCFDNPLTHKDRKWSCYYLAEGEERVLLNIMSSLQV